MLILLWSPYPDRNFSSFPHLWRQFICFYCFLSPQHRYHGSPPSSSTVFSMIVGLVVRSKYLNLDLCSSVKYCTTRVSPMGSLASSASTDGGRAISRRPRIEVWRASARDRVCLPFRRVVAPLPPSAFHNPGFRRFSMAPCDTHRVCDHHEPPLAAPSPSHPLDLYCYLCYCICFYSLCISRLFSFCNFSIFLYVLLFGSSLPQTTFTSDRNFLHPC